MKFPAVINVILLALVTCLVLVFAFVVGLGLEAIYFGIGAHWGLAIYSGCVLLWLAVNYVALSKGGLMRALFTIAEQVVLVATILIYNYVLAYGLVKLVVPPIAYLGSLVGDDFDFWAAFAVVMAIGFAVQYFVITRFYKGVPESFAGAVSALIFFILLEDLAGFAPMGVKKALLHYTWMSAIAGVFLLYAFAVIFWRMLVPRILKGARA